MGECASATLISKSEGTIQVGAFELPVSAFLDGKSRGHLQRWMQWSEQVLKALPGHWTDTRIIPAYREYLDRHFFLKPVARCKALYDVRIDAQTIGGVRTEVFTPYEGASAAQRERVLINLHGGGFIVGAPYGGQLESIPIASIGRIKVISVDYRMAPEWLFPAATHDVVAVYETLLGEYAPWNIGIYGCSAGALLTAQTIAHLQKEHLPLPGAIGMFSGAGSFWAQGDSAHLGTVLVGEPIKSLQEFPYFKTAAADDPMVFPVHSSELMAKFPPSLLIGATRDWVLSSVVHMHSRLTTLGVEAHLHLWEGLAHAFFYDPDLPQSREVHDLTVRFFDRYLGKH